MWNRRSYLKQWREEVIDRFDIDLQFSDRIADSLVIAGPTGAALRQWRRWAATSNSNRYIPSQNIL